MQGLAKPSAIHAATILLASVALVTLLVAPGSAEAQVKCFGRDATIVGALFGDDALMGTPGDDVIHGRSGDDIILGLGGNDFICGGTGQDRIFGGDGNDHISGGAGRDFLYGQGGNDTLVGGPNDAPGEKLHGGPGDDFLVGGSGNDTIEGGPGTDTLWGGPGDDSLVAGRGSSTLIGRGSDDFLLGGIGNDRLSAGSGDDRLIGFDGDDVLQGGPGIDECDGGLGLDIGIFCEESSNLGVDISALGSVSATSSFNSSFGPSLLLDHSARTSWFSAGADGGDPNPVLTWRGPRSFLNKIEIVGNTQHAEASFRSGFHFRRMDVIVYDGNDEVLRETNIAVSPRMRSDGFLDGELNHVADRIELHFHDSQSSECGGFSELLVFGLPLGSQPTEPASVPGLSPEK